MSAGITGGVMAVTESLRASNSITVTVLPCSQSGFSLNNYAAPQASHFQSWGCVDIDLPQVHDSPFITPSFCTARVKNRHISSGANIYNLTTVSQNL